MKTVEENKINQQMQTQQPATEPMIAASQVEAPKCGGNSPCGCRCLKKLLFVLLGVGLVGGLVWVGYSMGKRTTTVTLPPVVTGTPHQATPTVDMANWKTYTNEEYKFSLQYPQSFYYEVFNKAETSSVITPTWLLFLADLQRPTDQAHYPEIDIGFIQKPAATSLEDWLKLNTTTKDNANNPDPEDENKIYWGVKNISKLIVDDESAIRFSSSNGASTYQVVTLIDHKDKVFIIESVITPLGQIDDKIFDQILATFKFLDEPLPTSGVITPLISISYVPKADWQTYADEIAKFSFQYETVSTQPHNLHGSLGSYQPGKDVMIMTCSTPSNSGPSAGKEACLRQYSVGVYTNYSGGSRRDWLSKNIDTGSDCQRYYADVSVAGKNALLSTSDCSSWGETFVLIPNGSQMLVFLTDGYSRNDTTGKITLSDWLKETLSTFKFLD